MFGRRAKPAAITWAGALVVACALLAVAACSGALEDAPVDVGVDAAKDASAAATDASSSKQDWYVGPSDNPPDQNSEGWIRVDYPECNFYASPSPEKMAPLVWEPCPSVIDDLGFTCRRVKRPAQEGIGVLAATLRASASPLLAVSFRSGPWAVGAVTEVDGPMRQAFSYPPGQCFVGHASVSPTRAIFQTVRPRTTAVDDARGAIGGSIDEMVEALEPLPDAPVATFFAGDDWYLADGARSWDAGHPSLGKLGYWLPGTPDARQMVGKDLFLEFSDATHGAVVVHTPSIGTHDLLNDGTRTVDFGTDGVDMVWTEGADQALSSIVTAKFTTDAWAVKRHRVRSEHRALGLEPYVVGCGHAAHFISSNEDGNIIRIVRLSDGQSWRLKEVLTDAGYWLFQTPVLITCDEIFVTVQTGEVNVARIRLDSLGPGEPAD